MSFKSFSTTQDAAKPGTVKSDSATHANANKSAPTTTTSAPADSSKTTKS